jgi:heptosyltransferase-2
MSRSGTLLVDTSFLGDVLCAEPMVRRAAELWPGEPVDFLAQPSGAGMLAGHPALRELKTFDKRGDHRGFGGMRQMAAELRAAGYARAICSHRSWRTALLLKLAGIPRRTAFHNASGAWLYSERVRYPAELHEVQRNLALIEAAAGVGAEVPAWRAPRMYPSDEERSRAGALVPDELFVAVAPGSIWATKRWPAEHFAELVDELTEEGQAVVLVGGPDDRELCARIAAAAPAPAEGHAPVAGQVVDLSGRTSLRESYAVLERAACLVTNDSAPMHLGVAAGIPVVALYCSTDPSFGFAPLGPQDVVLEVEGLDCRPCGIHGHRECPEQHFRCGQDLAVATALAAVRERLATPV